LPYVNAKTIAANMKKSSVLGPIASIGRGKDVSLYAALLGNVSHYGTQIKLKSVDKIIKVGPRYVFVPIDQTPLALLTQDPRFIDRTDTLYPTNENRTQAPKPLIFELSVWNALRR